MNASQVMSTIFLIYSLQIYDEKKKPEVLVDGWNVYFFDDLKTLVRLLPSFIPVTGLSLVKHNSQLQKSDLSQCCPLEEKLQHDELHW